MRVKKRVKKGVKRGIKKVKSAPPEAYLAGTGVLVGGAAVLLLASTKKGQELLVRTAQLALRPEADEQDSRESDLDEADEQDSQDSDVDEADEQEPQDVDEADEQEPQDSDLDEADEQEPQDSDTQEDLESEPAENADVEGEPADQTNRADQSRVADLKPRRRRPRSAAPGRHPRSSGKATAPAES